MPEQRLIVPEEKWADDVFVHSDDPDDLPRVAAILDGGIPDFHGIRDVDQAKTAEETAAVKEVTAAINVFRAQLGLDMIGFDPDRCHLLTETDYEAHVSHSLPGSTAMAVYGHCYLTRPNDLSELVIDLTHEMSHAIAYLAIDVICRPGRKPLLFFYRNGYLRQRRHDGRIIMAGLNEAATEIMAINLRDIIRQGSRVLDDEGAKRISGLITSYFPQVRLITDLINDLMDNAPDEQPLKEFFLGYLTGENRFLRRLAAAYPGILQALCRMDQTAQSAIAVAERFGLPDTAEEIRQGLADSQSGGAS